LSTKFDDTSFSRSRDKTGVTWPWPSTFGGGFHPWATTYYQPIYQIWDLYLHQLQIYETRRKT